MTLVTLAQERRSQPQQILDLQREYSDLVQRFALDSQAIHRQLLEHDAGLVYFKGELDAHGAELTDYYRMIVRHESLLCTRTFWQRLRWIVRGEL